MWHIVSSHTQIDRPNARVRLAPSWVNSLIIKINIKKGCICLHLPCKLMWWIVGEEDSNRLVSQPVHDMGDFEKGYSINMHFNMQWVTSWAQFKLLLSHQSIAWFKASMGFWLCKLWIQWLDFKSHLCMSKPNHISN
jgi:hypothetical protein